jgi:hypothetical protein
MREKKERERVQIATTVTILFVAVYSSIIFVKNRIPYSMECDDERGPQIFGD